MNAHIIKTPVITEKSLNLANTQNVYTFEVDRHANKNQIKEVIEQVFSVDVEDVNTVRKYRVRKSTGKKRMKTLQGTTKKALVKIKAGQTIEVFDVYSA